MKTWLKPVETAPIVAKLKVWRIISNVFGRAGAPEKVY